MSLSLQLSSLGLSVEAVFKFIEHSNVPEQLVLHEKGTEVYDSRKGRDPKYQSGKNRSAKGTISSPI